MMASGATLSASDTAEESKVKVAGNAPAMTHAAGRKQVNGHRKVGESRTESCHTRAEPAKESAPRRRLSIWQVVRLTWREEKGLKGFYRGLLPSLMLITNPAVHFVVYEQLIKLCKQSLGRGSTDFGGPLPDLSSWQYFLIAGTAKAIATVLSYPFQVRRNQQSGRGNGEKGRDL